MQQPSLKLSDQICKQRQDRQIGIHKTAKTGKKEYCLDECRRWKLTPLYRPDIVIQA